MDNFQSVLGRAAGGALCNVLSTYGSAAPLLTAFSLIEPTPFVEVAAVTSGLAALAAQTGCTWDTQGEGPPTQQFYSGCKKLSSGKAKMQWSNLSTGQTGFYFTYSEITGTYIDTRFGEQYTAFTYINDPGTAEQTADGLPVLEYGNFIGVLQDGAVCEEPAPPGVEPTPDPFDYTDDETGCSLTVNFKGWGINQVGGASGVWQIEPAAEQLRQGGGVIGGCNFNPVIYVDDGGGGGGGLGPPGLPYAPVPPGGPLSPETLQEIAREILSGAIGAIIANQLNALFETPYQGTTYRLVSVCETDAGGEPISQAVTEVIPALNSTEAILSRLDALVPLLQGQKDFKQPICPPTKLEGEFRTISFRSEEVSPNGKSCLRKRLRYRSISGIGLDGLIDWWKDFSFQAGPVCVKHRGATWGTITVWASSVDEGKRVILHAAGEAGIDANQTGRWEVSGSSSTRLGMPGTMKIDITGGYYWITARDGSNNRPIVGKT